jgi:hypothetical protein
LSGLGVGIFVITDGQPGGQSPIELCEALLFTQI